MCWYVRLADEPCVFFYAATESRVEKKAAMGKRDAGRWRKRKEVSLRH